jgi:hypothetical protein
MPLASADAPDLLVGEWLAEQREERYDNERHYSLVHHWSPSVGSFRRSIVRGVTLAANRFAENRAVVMTFVLPRVFVESAACLASGACQ